MLSSFAPWCAETCIRASERESKKPHQGFAGHNLILHRGVAWSKSTLALGLPEWAGKTASGPAVAANNGNTKTVVACFVKGAALGAVTALAVGAVAVIAAPVVGATAVTVGLGVLAVAGAASLGANVGIDISKRNWAGVAYDAGSLAGGLAAGFGSGAGTAKAIDPNATPGWSPQSWGAQAYDSSKGTFGQFMGTGPTQASAGLANGAGGFLSSLFGAGCR
jgi:hypothetical protein